MLLTNRRYRLLFMSLAGMEVAWFLPFALTMLARGQVGMMARSELATMQLGRLTGVTPLIAVLLTWAILLLYMLVADLLNRRLIDSPQRELILLGAVVVTTLVSIRVLLYPTIPLTDGRWLRGALGSVFNYTEGWRPELALILINLFLWWRVVMASGRELTFFQVGMSFRLGMLLALVGNGLLVALGNRSASIAIQYFWIFFAYGLIAVGLARIDEKSIVGEHSTGTVLPWSRFAQLLLAVFGVLGGGALLARIYTPQNLRTFLGWFSPLWDLLGFIAFRIALLFVWLLAPVMNWIVNVLRRMLENMEIPEQETQGPVEFGPMTQDEFFSLADALREWTMLRYCLVTFIVVVALALIFLLYVRTQNRSIAAEEEEAEPGEVSLGGDALRRGWDRLREMANLLRRFGLSEQLLDAISVQNMYANLGRIARQRGYPRQPNQPPDEYLPALIRAFPTEPDALSQLTNAYMRVHYGDQPIEGDELTRLRADYERVRTSPGAADEAAQDA